MARLSNAASTRKIRRTTFSPRPAASCNFRSRPGRASESIPAYTRDGLSRSTMTQCWRSSSSGPARGNTLSNGCSGALSEFHVGGIKTNIPLFRVILNDPAFRAGELHTGYLDDLLKTQLDWNPRPSPELAGIAARIAERQGQSREGEPAAMNNSGWLASRREDLLR